jgi:hypothetical protein
MLLFYPDPRAIPLDIAQAFAKILVIVLQHPEHLSQFN